MVGNLWSVPAISLVTQTSSDTVQDNEGQNQMNRGWERFEASSKGFPQGLQHAITNIRQKYPAIKHIAVWHALVSTTYKNRFIDR